MTNVNIEKYPKTGEFCATLDFGNREVSKIPLGSKYSDM